MNEKILELKKNLEQLNEITANIKIKKAEFEKSILNESNLKEELEGKIEVLKDSIEQDAISYFRENNDKNYIGGIKVQELKNYDYDPNKAFMWAMEHKLFLQLNQKQFETYIKTFKELPEELKSIVTID